MKFNRNLVLLFMAAFLLLLFGYLLMRKPIVTEETAPSFSTAAVPAILPPADQHPRLLITEDKLPGIRRNLSAAQNKDAFDEFTALWQEPVSGSLPPDGADDSNYDKQILRSAEAKAFLYLIDGNSREGAEAVSIMQDFLSTVYFHDDYSSRVYRSAALFSAALVYDWCYDLISPDERSAYIAACEKLAEDGVMGWPPSGQRVLTGFGAGTYLLRDSLAMGVAFYDEKPEIYHYAAGRILEEYLPAHNAANASGIFLQGTSYGPERFLGNLFASMIFSTFTEETTFDLSSMAYGLVYLLRPDGQPFRLGDNYVEVLNRSFPELYAPIFLYLSSLLQDPVLKEMYEACVQDYYYGEGLYTPVLHLIVNDPLLEGDGVSDLPRTRYFGSPEGLMSARTGWEFGSDSAETAVLMKIGEYWGSNHAHLDAGTFQIYHRGALACKSGFYDEYSSIHETGYNKRSIAQNSISIFAEDEPEEEYAVPWYPASFNDGGQRWPAKADEPASLEEWQDGSYTRARTLSADFGPDPHEPEYSFLKGDITGAYWPGKASEVVRNMLFLPGDEQDGTSAFLVFDKVSSIKAEQEKKVLLHTMEEPEITKNKALITTSGDSGGGRMQLTALLPLHARLSKIGGEGKQFLVNGENLEPEAEPASRNESGWGRIEISSSGENTTEYFLQVFLIQEDDSVPTAIPVSLQEDKNTAGAVFLSHLILFTRQTEPCTEMLSISVPDARERTVLIAGLAKGEWRVTTAKSTIPVTVAEDNGIARFQLPADSGRMILQPDFQK